MKAKAKQTVESKVSGERILGAGKAITHLPNEEELERIDPEWKQQMEEDREWLDLVPVGRELI